MMWHNLEHHLNTNIILKKNFQIIKNNGSLIIEVANSNSLQSKIDKMNWIYWDVPRHINHFTFDSLNYVLKKMYFILKK